MKIKMTSTTVGCAMAIAIGMTSATAQTNAPSDEIPASWPRFQLSERKDDKATVAQIERMDWWKVCVAWGVEARKKSQSRRMWAMQEYLKWGNFINGPDLGGVRGKIPEIGMSTCGAYAVLGLPNQINRTKGAWGAHVQHVWRDKRVYVYTESKSDEGNALVSSVQY